MISGSSSVHCPPLIPVLLVCFILWREGARAVLLSMRMRTAIVPRTLSIHFLLFNSFYLWSASNRHILCSSCCFCSCCSCCFLYVGFADLTRCIASPPPLVWHLLLLHLYLLLYCCLFVGLLVCWFVGLLACWFVGFDLLLFCGDRRWWPVHSMRELLRLVHGGHVRTTATARCGQFPFFTLCVDQFLYA